MSISDSRQELNWAIACHLSALAGFMGLPFGHVLGPLIVWFLKKNDFPLVDKHGKEALNFQLSMSIYMFVAGLLILMTIGVLMLLALMAVDLVLVIMAAIKTNSGEDFQYPFTIRFFK